MYDARKLHADCCVGECILLPSPAIGSAVWIPTTHASAGNKRPLFDCLGAQTAAAAAAPPSETSNSAGELSPHPHLQVYGGAMAGELKSTVAELARQSEEMQLLRQELTKAKQGVLSASAPANGTSRPSDNEASALVRPTCRRCRQLP